MLTITSERLPASLVQEWLGVEDGEIIAHGYTFDRNTVDIWFENGKLIRREYMPREQWTDKEIKKQESEEFEPQFFFNQIKRWYQEQTNSILIALFRAFGQHGGLTLV